MYSSSSSISFLAATLLPLLRPILAATNLTTSTTGSCGSDVTCLDSQWGNCCSANSFCGDNSTYCGAGCQLDFGACYVNSTLISPAADGTCGAASPNQYTCLGSTFGNCCSANGFCGANDTYCGSGCQAGYGVCGVDNAASAFPATTVLGGATVTSAAATSTNAGPTSSGISSRTSTTSAGASSSGTSSGASGAAASATAAATASSSSSGLSTGAKAGIGIGVALGVLAVIGVVAFVLLRRRRKNITTAPPKSAEMPSSTVSRDGKPPYHDDKKFAPSEMGAEHGLGGPAVELPTATGYAELPAGERERIARVDDRAEKGYEGAYRGN